MPTGSLNSGTPVQISASTLVKNTSGTLVRIFVSAASATPTITVYDSSTAATNNKIVDVFTPTAGTSYTMEMGLANGCYVVISGTVSATIVVA